NEGQQPDEKEIFKLIKEIEIRYDRQKHINIATSLTLLFNRIFEHENETLPFTSQNGRDLAHIAKLKEYREKGLGVVYLINHSSHLDEFLVDILWQHLSLGLPVFAAGQNMMAIKSIASLLMVGSYIVLRQGANKHQMSALYNYCRAISMSGEQQGIFLEAWRGGARSRDGSLRYPKRLVTLRGAIDIETDLVVQPISLSFSAIPEDLPLCSRKSPVSWVRGLGFFRTLLRFPLNPKTFLWKSAKHLYGRAYISVPHPFLLSELKEKHKQDKSGIHLDEFVALSAIKEIAKSKKIMSSQITALGLLKARKEGKIDMVESVARQMNAAKDYHLQTFGVTPDFEDFIVRNSVKNVVDDGLGMLARRKVVSKWRKDKKGYPVVIDETALSYYATHADRRLYSPTADQNIVVVGAGNWGFALASLIGNRILDDKKYNTASLTIFDPRIDVAEQMGLNRNGPGKFSESLLPKNVFVTSDFSSAFRKASDVIIAAKPSNFEETFNGILAVSEQPFKALISTRGFIPDLHTLPYLAAVDLLNKSKRKDVHLYTLTGPVDPDILVVGDLIKGVLAGKDDGTEDLCDLFDTPFVETFISKDPVGVQTADILSRIYALWLNYAKSSGRIQTSTQTGYLMAQVADEACALAINLGGSPKTFEAGSIPWTATFTSLYLGGLWKEFGQKVGTGVKKGKTPRKMLSKIQLQYENDGIQLQSIADMESALICAKQYHLEMPILSEAVETFRAAAVKKK
ncbi:MAG: 1-acyl-sn-glycerol-3-phosphate acyltransferase, partial [Proteobacteria bacterium]|nr:1-acyl-sn-glycerol-3-phosphate acyltransferase [Pseudomonadota bacterium]MBU1582701.1 1-acyl-sn-glycerol-3-phosphate acyltransferase [Pseudomonadota bacterium]